MMLFFTEEELDRSKPKPPVIGHRHAVAALVMLAGITLYVLRYNLSTAIIAMAKFNKTQMSISGDVCINDQGHSYKSGNASVNTTLEEGHNGEFEWNETTQGVILGAFFYGYVVFQLVGGRLSELFGPKWLCAIGVVASIAINALTPVIARSEIYWLLIASRVTLGMFQAMLFPSFYELFSKWAPDHERSTCLALPSIGGNIGTIIAASLSGYLSDHGFDGGWPSVFYVSAMVGFIWLILWVIYVSNTPEDHKWISNTEKKHIDNNIGVRADQRKRSVPWIAIFTSMPLIATVISKFTVMWNYLLFMLKLPAYLKTVFDISGTENGFITAMVNLVITLSLFISGIVADKIIQKKLIDKTLLRKIFQVSGKNGLNRKRIIKLLFCLASFGSSICLVIIPFADCDRTFVFVLLFIGSFLVGMMSGGDLPVYSEMSSNFSATVFALANTVACLGGILIPLVTGVIVDFSDRPRQQWAYVFYLSAVLNLFGGLLYIKFGSAEQQSWDKDYQNLDNSN